MKTEADFSDSICPICGKNNDCAMRAGDKTDECWCKSVKIEAGILKNIPSHLQGKVCICKACATPARKSRER